MTAKKTKPSTSSASAHPRPPKPLTKEARGLDKALDQKGSEDVLNKISSAKNSGTTTSGEANSPIPARSLNLAEILGQKTEFKPPVNLNLNREPAPGTEPPVPQYNDGLDDEEIARHSSTPEGEDNGSVDSELSAEEEWKKIWTPEKSAEVVWKTIDPLQAELYSGALRRKLGKDAYKMGKALRKSVREGSRKESELNVNERVVLTAYEDYLDETEDLPYSDYELEALITSTAAIMRKKGVALPPELALAMAVLKTNGVRMMAVKKFEA